MAETTAIEWATHTFSPWVGCTKISPACDHCYAEAWAKRSGHPELWQGSRRRTTEANWKQPLKWDAQAAKNGTRPRVFCSSLADVFDNEVPPQWRADLFRLIKQCQNLYWLLLTKRIGNAARMLPSDWGDGYPNVWLGATIANQAEADRDIPKLLATPARLRFLSCEPLLGAVDLRHIGRYTHYSLNIDALTGWTTRGQLAMKPSEASICVSCSKDMPAINWVIAGGESGGKARPSHPDWFRSLRDQCEAAGVAFFMKQMGGKRDKREALDSIPEDLRYREWPRGL